MTTALAILKKFEGVSVLDAAKSAIIETREYAVAVQKVQLFQGLESTDLKIIPSYAAKTVAIKKRKGQPTDRVTLKDTGAFYRGIRIDVVGELIRIDSVDPKKSDLETKYGKEIFGLGTQARTDYIPKLKIAFVKNIRGYLR